VTVRLVCGCLCQKLKRNFENSKGGKRTGMLQRSCLECLIAVLCATLQGEFETRVNILRRYVMNALSYCVLLLPGMPPPPLLAGKACGASYPDGSQIVIVFCAEG